MEIIKNSKSILNYNKIICIGDIHGDIENLIICLADLCKCVKNANYNKTLLDADINENYDPSLGLAWNENFVNTCIILMGDIIDNIRKQVKQENVSNHLYEEIKIHLLINHLNEQAQRYNCKLIKIIGNHDYYNYCGSTSSRNYVLSMYVSDFDKKHPYKDVSRRDYFYYTNPVFTECLKNSLPMLFINNKLFLHGGISDYIVTNINFNLDTFEIINKIILLGLAGLLNDASKLFTPHELEVIFKNKYAITNDNLPKYSKKLFRIMTNIKTGIFDSRELSMEKSTLSCDYLLPKIKNAFCTNTACHDNFKIIMGHSVALIISNEQNKVIYNTNYLECHDNNVMSNTFKISNRQYDNMFNIPGIVGECDIKLYYTDVGMSKAFEFPLTKFINTQYLENNRILFHKLVGENYYDNLYKLLYSYYCRLPQILIFDNDRTEIVKYKLSSYLKNKQQFLHYDDYIKIIGLLETHQKYKIISKNTKIMEKC